jgi:hypothetical protein
VKRRTFIAGLPVAAARPVVARAQQALPNIDLKSMVDGGCRVRVGIAGVS